MLFKKVVRFLLIIVLFFTAHLWSSKPVSATTAIEQQINIINQEVWIQETTDFPTDNSLGLVRWTSGSYTGATVYFEGLLAAAASSTVYATLYDSGGSTVSGGAISTSVNGYVRVRSGAITLVDGTDYTVRVRSSGTANPSKIKFARFIILQSDSTKLTNTETQIEVGNSEGTSSTSYTQLTDKKIYRYDSSKFTPAPTSYFEASFRPSSPLLEQQINIMDQEYLFNSTTDVPTDNSLGIVKWTAGSYTGATVYFEAVIKPPFATSATSTVNLYDKTADATVTNSTLSTGTQTYTRLRSSAITLTDGNEYTVRIKASRDDFFAGIKSARLIIVQSNSTKLTDSETQIEVGNGETITSASYLPLTDKKIYNYDSSKFTPDPSTMSFEASFRSFSPMLEQQINIIDQVYLTTSTTYAPTDNSLGLIRWTSGSYTGATTYFEAVLNPEAGSCTTYAALYNSSGTEVTNSEISTDLDAAVRKRSSSSITLVDGTDYTIRVKSSNAGCDAKVRAARIIVVQSDNTRIDDTETQVEVGNYVTDLANTTYSTLTDHKIYLYDTNKFSGTESIYFEATLHSDSQEDTVSAQLLRCTSVSDCSGGTAVTGSEITTNSTSYTRVRSGNIFSNMTDDANYAVQIKTSAGTADLINAKVINVQDGGGTGLTDVEVVHQFINTLSTQATATYTDKDYNSLFDTGNFGVKPVIYYEASLKVNTSSTAYNRLKDELSGTAITGSEVTTTNTSYTRVRSASDLRDNLYYNAEQKFETQVRNSTTNTTAVSTSWFVIQLSGIPTSGPTGSVGLYPNHATDCASQVGEVSYITDVNYTRQRTTVTLSTGTDYMVCAKTAFLSNAKIIFNQSAVGGISDVELVHEYINALETDADTGYTDQDVIQQFQLANFGVQPLMYYEATMKVASASTGSTKLIHNVTGGGSLTNSEITTTSTSYTRVRGSSTIKIDDFQVGTANLDTQIKNSTTVTTSVSSSWIVYQLSNIPTSGPTGSVGLYPDHATDCSSQAAEVTYTADANFTRQRTSVSLSNGTDYIVCAKSAILSGAKIVHVQSQANGIENVELVHDQINTLITDSDTGYTATEYLNAFNPDNFSSGTFDYFFEATLKATAGTAYAILENDDNSNDQINNLVTSEVTVISTSYTRVRSSALGGNADWPASSSEMETLIKNSATNTTSASVSRLIIQSSRLPTFPPDPTSPAQFKSDSTTSISTGGSTEETTVVLKTSMTDTDSSSTLVPHIEIQPIGTSFVNTGNYLGAGVSYSGTAVTGPVTVSNNWYNDSWAKRKLIAIVNNTASTLTNYQVQISITYDSDMQDDFEDLRFTSSNGTTLIDHWIETYTASTSAVVWIEVPSISASDTGYVFMYYGNGGASTASNGDNTFTFFDEFSGVAIDSGKWTETDSTGWSVTGGELKGTNTTGRLTSVSTFSDGVVLQSKGRVVTHASNGYTDSGFFLSTTDAFGYLNINGNDFYRNNGTFTGISSGPPTSTNYLTRISTKSTTEVNLSVTNYSDGTSYQNINVANTVSSEPIVIGRRYDNGNQGQTYEAYWDFFFVRVYATTEPSTSTGAEQSKVALTEATSYHWQVQTCDAEFSCSSWVSYGGNAESAADFTVDQTAPTTPGTPSTTTPTSDTTPTWTWTASTDSGSGLAATPYTVQWCQDSGFSGCGANTDTSSTNSYTHSVALAEGTWYFRVKATDAVGNESSYSSNGSALIDATGPTTPGTPSTTTPTADTTPSWTWTASSDSGSGLAATPYTVEWCTDSGFSGCGSNTDTSSTNSFTHSTALADGTWYVRVKAADVVGNESLYSSNGTVVIDSSGPTTPGTPASTSLTTDTTPEWTWTASTDSGVGLATTPYTVAWCTDSGFSGCAANTDTSSTNSFTHTTALAAGTWYFRVKAEDTLGNESSYSTSGTFTIASASTGDRTKPSKPGTPETTSPTNNNKPKWKWDESTDNVALDSDNPYYVQWCTNKSFKNCDGKVDTSDDNSYTHGSTLSDGTWYFRVKARDSSGNYSNYSNRGTVEIDTTAPTITITSTVVSETSISISWTTNEESQTIIEWGTNSSYGRSYTNDSLTKSHNYNITGLREGTLYYIKITSKDELLNTGKAEFQRQTLGTIEATLITDINVVINSPTSATINWKTNHAATSEIDYGITTNFTDQTISTDKVVIHSMTLSGLTSETTYFYEIISVGNTTAVNAFRTFDTPGEEIIEEPVDESTGSQETTESTSAIDEIVETIEDIVDTITDTIKDIIDEIIDTVKDIVDKITEIIRTEEFNKPVDTVFAVGIKKLIRDLPIPQIIKEIAEKTIDVIKSPQTQKIITFAAIAGNIASAVTVLPNIREIISMLGKIKHVNILGLLFGLFRKKKNPWGVVYDSQSKQPLDPVILTLTDPSGKIYQTISDIYGRFEFIVDPGVYILSAVKTNYSFPSKLLAGKKDDGIYDNLYFGEPINIQQDQKIQAHIPMDRENVDWNQLEKQRMGIVNRNVRLYKVVDYMFNATLVLNILSLSLSYSLEKIVIFSLFIFLYTYHNYIKSHKPWGIVTNLENHPLGGIIMRLVHVKFPKISGAIAVTKDNGRYNFLVRKGTYQIVAHKKNPDGTTQEINRSKVMDVKKEQGSLGPDFKVDAKEESIPETKQDSAISTNPDNKLDTNNK